MAGKSLIQSIDRAFEALEFVCEAASPQRCGVIAEKLGIEPSTARNILRSLCVHGYLTQNDQKEYLPGSSCFRLGDAVKSRFERFGDAARGPVWELFRNTGKITFFGCDYYGALYAVVAVSESGVLEVNGHQNWLNALHATAAGKIIIAEKGMEWYRELCFREPREKFTEKTVITVENMALDVEKIRRDGYALVDGENLLGFVSIGVAVRQKSGELLGGIAQCFPDYFLNTGKIVLSEQIETLKECAAAITRVAD
eukprot:TRINITY_DN3205_c0_g2_i1.p1 TRINITY_DN3205_c0_g2~~TRINITY_DN3205_c0_g2_i1.p1  ORF type:complete len:255 (+),score=53.42 TRINITY_DN3205_c0_g2_i1:391-1155(+)